MLLSKDQIRQYHEDGFLIVPNFFSREQLQPVIQWINSVVDDLAERLYAAGKIRDKHADADFYTRLTKLEKEFPGAAVLVHIYGILGQPLADLWGCKQLLDVVEQVLGPEIAGHPVWNLRTKTPLNPLTTVPWHQDTAFMAAGAEHTFQPTAWIPFIDADSVNGTLRTLRGGHRSGKVFPHQQYKKTWYLYITDDDLPEGEVVTCEMPIGSLLLFNQLLPHCSTENFSDKIRWSVDLRWQRPDEFSGYEGIKDCILMRTARDPNYRADWSAWAKQNRIAGGMDDKPSDPFDTTVTGPWLHRWAKDSAGATT
ncbi:MAG: phytanoyl-CoA dioxygenase family protein [Thermoguttaceae bacterium]